METWHEERNRLDEFVHSSNPRVLIDIAESFLSWTKSVDEDTQLTAGDNHRLALLFHLRIRDEIFFTRLDSPVYPDLWHLFKLAHEILTVTESELL